MHDSFELFHFFIEKKPKI